MHFVRSRGICHLGSSCCPQSIRTRVYFSSPLERQCHCPVGVASPSLHIVPPPRAASSPPLARAMKMKLLLLRPCLLLAFFAAAALASSSSSPPPRETAEAATVGVVSSSDSDPENECVYTVYVRTGSIWKGGTDSTIGVTLLGADGTGIRISDLVSWGGLMGDAHDYYERGNLDIFSGRGPCMAQTPCAMNLTSDGANAHHGWYCNYLEVTATGPHLGCAQSLFTVEQWLATDAPPYRLYSVVDNCGKTTRAQREETPRAATVAAAL